MGSPLGSRKTAARKIGISLEEYDLNISKGVKWCTKCKSWKPLSGFYRDTTRGDGFSAKCIDCLSEGVEYPGTHERRSKAALGLAWCRFCKDWLTTHQVRGGMCNNHRNEYARNAYHTNPKVRAERTQHAHSRKRHIDPVPVVGQEVILEDFEGKCAYCGAPAESWDHVIPISKGGETEPWNIVPACIACNSSKNDSDLMEWLEKRGFTLSHKVIDRMSIEFVALSR